MSDEPTIHLTQAEMTDLANESFDSGAKAAFDSLRTFIDAMEERVANLRGDA